LRKGVVYLPTYGEVEKGFYRAIEPVAVIPLSNLDALRRAIRETIARGNPKIPNLPRARLPAPLLPKYAGVKNQATFDRGANTWGIEEKNGIYRIVWYRESDSRGWEEDTDRLDTLSVGSTANDAIDRLIAIMLAANED
jgi:hypothetical protein